ncbi:hypothetical protein G7046_g6121 [Stylonectria norvegica]|nr:hypothetical protein G7046_g6121 [Stylonectria norvegica]
MGISLRWIVNFGLLALPIGTTLGVLLGMQSHRTATGQPNPFKPVPDNKVTPVQSCEKAFGITPETTGLEYTLNPNQWGWTEGDPGHLCLNVTTFNNKSYATDTTAPPFFVTWSYPRGPEDAPVHAFPNIKVDGGALPIQIKSIGAIDVDLQWSYGMGNKSVKSTDVVELVKNEVNTNVAIDMFVDSDKTAAQDSTKAKFEVMVWFAAIGSATQPLGYEAGKGNLTSKTVGDVKFNLFAAQNSLKQYVLTWVAEDTTEKFTGDLSVLYKEILSMKNADFPTESDYLGYMGLGSETLSTNDFVTFDVPLLSIDIQASSTK